MQQSVLPLQFGDETHDSLGFELEIKRSPRRRTIEIVIRDGRVHLMLPQFVATDEGMAFVRDKRAWILKTLDKHRQHCAEIVRREYVEGAPFSYLGREYPLRIYLGKRSAAQLVNDCLYLGIARRWANATPEQKSTAVQKALWSWYQAEARRILTAKVDALTQRIGRPYQAIQLRRTKTKWGHCTRDGVLQFNWQIICAPEPVVDYLVAHEVSHLVHQNHGVRFWRHVEKLFPGYREPQQWLKRHGHRLTV